jgi:putative ABC transport system ATP-binding protein
MIEIKGLSKVYDMGKSTAVLALREIDLFVGAGEFIAIMGPSGSGKSTLMNMIGCLDRPSGGTYSLDGHLVSTLDDDELAAIRNTKIGFVFQTFNLLPRLNALQNVELPLIYRGLPPQKRRAVALEALGRVGLSDRTHHRPTELSGGQQQRVAIARAISGSPAIILADEPTGNLDSRSGEEVLQVFQDLNDGGITVVLVTHDENLGRHSKRLIRLWDGTIKADDPVSNRALAADILGAMPPVVPVAPVPSASQSMFGSESMFGGLVS